MKYDNRLCRENQFILKQEATVNRRQSVHVLHAALVGPARAQFQREMSLQTGIEVQPD
jgi:hypothetical protein